MNRESCIPHPPSEPFLCIRRGYYNLMEGDDIAAILLNVFEYLANGMIAINESLANNDCINVGSRKVEDFERLTFGIVKNRQLRSKLKKLEDWGFITTVPVAGKPHEYLFNKKHLIDRLNGEDPNPGKNCHPDDTLAKIATLNPDTPAKIAGVDPGNFCHSSIYKDLYLKDLSFKDRDRAKNQTESDPQTNTLPVDPQSSSGSVDQPERVAQDKNSAAAAQSGNDFDLDPEARQWLCYKAPWRLSITEFRDEMIEAFYRTSPRYWSLDGGKRNGTAIAHYLQVLERRAMVYNGSYQYEQEVLSARADLLRHWELAQRIASERSISPVPVTVPDLEESPEGLEAFEKFKAGLLCKRGA